MEARAPYHTEAPKGPRNLTAPLAAWLRKQGFTATEQQPGPAYAAVAAYWLGPSGERYELDYLWTGGRFPDATCRLAVRYTGQVTPEVLFTAQRVRRLREARLLLTTNVRYANARVLETLAGLAPHVAS
ncbi:MAG: hypothetical protein ACRYF0_04210 [Janthinobacterium lividum]